MEPQYNLTNAEKLRNRRREYESYKPNDADQCVGEYL